MALRQKHLNLDPRKDAKMTTITTTDLAQIAALAHENAAELYARNVESRAGPLVYHESYRESLGELVWILENSAIQGVQFRVYSNYNNFTVRLLDERGGMSNVIQLHCSHISNTTNRTGPDDHEREVRRAQKFFLARRQE